MLANRFGMGQDEGEMTASGLADIATITSVWASSPHHQYKRLSGAQSWCVPTALLRSAKKRHSGSTVKDFKRLDRT
jgi:hypothetical protein